MSKTQKKALKITLNKDEALASLHLRICRRDFSLRHVATRVHYDRVVGVKPEEVRQFQFGAVRTEPALSPVTEALWTRIRYGPTALENKEIRQAIVKAQFNLRPVRTRLSTKPVVFSQDKKCGGENQAILSEVVRFDCKKLRHVQPKVSHKVLVCRSFPQRLKEEIKRFPSVQLNHVEPKVSRTPVKGEAEKNERIILRAIRSFDKCNLNEVNTLVKTKPQVVVKTEQKVEKKEEKKAVAKTASPAPSTPDLKLVVANVETLFALGFEDKKKNFQLLFKNNNDLVLVIEFLLDQKLAQSVSQ
jgi:hypothetical protein